MFGRRERKSREPAEPDPHLPGVDREEGAALVASAQREFAVRGVATSYREGVLHAEGGAQYALHNLATQVAGEDAGRRELLVLAHVIAITSEDPGPVGEDAREALVLQLFPRDDIPDGPPPGAPEVLPGIVALAGLDLPTRVDSFTTDDKLEPYGGWAAVEPRARENLRRLPAPQHQTILGNDDDPESAVHVFVTDGEDLLGASRLLVLDTLLPTVEGLPPATHGVLVAVPNRHLLAVHVLTGLSVLTAMQTLAAIAEGEHSEAPGPLSPEVFYLPRNAPAEQVTRIEDGKRIVAVDGAFAQAFFDLGLLEDG
jgi:hypothetical protein